MNLWKASLVKFYGVEGEHWASVTWHSADVLEIVKELQIGFMVLKKTSERNEE